MMTCPTCGNETNKLIDAHDLPKLVCPMCFQSKNRTNVNLGQTNDKWVDDKGRTHRITEGKKWEIEHRVISKDDYKTPVNSATGKPAQY